MDKKSKFKNWLVVIPARLDSVRLSEKLLQDLQGLPLIVRVYKNAKNLEKKGALLLVATDSKKILLTCAKHEVPAVLTSKDHQCGSDRVFEVAKLKGKPFILNIQGDEPFLNMADIENLLDAFMADKKADIGTMAFASTDKDDFVDPNVVKTVVGKNGYALYFSRAQIPFARVLSENAQFLQHAGVYCYRRKSLEAFCKSALSQYEKIEKLEQLRALEEGLKIKVMPMRSKPFGIDTQADLEKARARCKPFSKAKD